MNYDYFDRIYYRRLGDPRHLLEGRIHRGPERIAAEVAKECLEHWRRRLRRWPPLIDTARAESRLKKMEETKRSDARKKAKGVAE